MSPTGDRSPLFSVLVTLCLIALVVLLAASNQLYILRGGSGALIYSRGPEAIIFLGESPTGYHYSYLRYPLNVALSVLLAHPTPDDQCTASLVVHITPSGISRSFSVERNFRESASLLTPFEDGLYGQCPGNVLCKWNGQIFLPASADESRRLGGTPALVYVDKNHEIVNGWLVSYLRRNTIEHFSVPLGPALTISAQTLATSGADLWAKVDLLRPNQPPENLYNLDGRSRWVSKAEYDRTFAACK